MKKGIIVLMIYLLSLPTAFAFGEIEIQDVTAQSHSPTKYSLHGSITNHTDVPREVTLRAQITFYDRTIAKGDKPVTLIRKDFIEIIEPNETKNLNVTLLNEGTPPKGSLRLEPMLRIRRQREWNY